jgi:hypothetical protein
MKPNYNYPTLAQRVGNDPGFAIFRRYATLNAKNLLYLQAEIALLEDELELLELEDQRSDEETRRNFQWVARLLMEDVEGESVDADGLDQVPAVGSKNPKMKSKQWAKILEIRAKLKEYSADPFPSRGSRQLITPRRNPSYSLRAPCPPFSQ